jgi:hypothetical protein
VAFPVPAPAFQRARIAAGLRTGSTLVTRSSPSRHDSAAPALPLPWEARPVTTLRRCAAVVAVAGGGAAVMTLQWWAVLVALPALGFALAVDPDRPLDDR